MARQRGRRRDSFEADSPFEDNVVQIDRCSKVVKGGRKLSFSALVVVGDRGGQVGLGYGKANEVPDAVEKGISEARKSLMKVPLRGTTIPHEVIGRAGASRVVLVPASPGTGVIAGKKIRPLFELAGIENLLTKAYGSTSPKNLLKAGLDALHKLRTAETVSELRGVKIQ
ncbi:MAG: 30S ribosomal protein S5 [Planctomycetes bacterium]|nr:30S ribosomal protein S5 [Planctomycetota bacterium]